MPKALNIITIFLVSFVLNQTELILLQEYNAPVQYITTDQLKNLYLVYHSEIQKITENGKTTKYSNNLFGDISVLDVSDPFKLLIFNKDFNKVQYLDQNLTAISDPMSLDELGYFNVQAICQSGKGGLWIYDQSLAQILYINQRMKTTQKSIQLSELIDADEDHNRIFMLEKNDYIYLGIEAQGVFVFDGYGTYMKTFPLTDISSFQVVDNSIIYFADDKLIRYHTETFNKEKLDLPIHHIEHARIEGQKIYIQAKNKVSIFKANRIK